MELKTDSAKNMARNFNSQAAQTQIPPLEKDLPKPRPASAGSGKLAALAVLAVICLGLAAFWLSRDAAKREQWRGDAAEYLDNLTRETPLSGIGNILRPSPPPPPEIVLNPPTAPGTLAGRNVQGSLKGADAAKTQDGQNIQESKKQEKQADAEQDASQAAQSSLEAQAADSVPRAENPENFIPKVTEDSRVRPDYLADLANWLAARYRPGPATLAVTVQALNQRAGGAFAAKVQGGRAGLLRYAFHPSMIQGLYGLYIGRFLEELDHAAMNRGLTEAQNRQFHLALSEKSQSLAQALAAVAAVPDLAGRLTALDAQGEKALEINSQMANAVFELDELRERKASSQEISTMQLRLDGLSARFRRALDDQASAQRALVGVIRKQAGTGLDDESLFFLAQWVDRRLRSDSEALASVKSAVQVLADFARRSAEEARQR